MKINIVMYTREHQQIGTQRLK